MATRHIEQIIDDLDGSVLDDDEAKRVSFAIDGRQYEIDLSTENARMLSAAFAPFVDAARRTGSLPAASPRRASTASGIDLSAVRTWARSNGHTVSDRGRVPSSIIEAFKAAS